MAFRRFVHDIRESVQIAIYSPEDALQRGYNPAVLQDTEHASLANIKPASQITNWRRWLSWAGLQVSKS